MNRKIFLKTILTFLLAFFAAGGACNPPAQTVSSEKMIAADVFTFYRIEEYLSSNGGKCTRRITTQFSDDNKIFKLQPPARATYNGAEISDGGESGCQTDKAEFVLFDAQGGTKTDRYELKKAKLVFPAQIDRTQDLRIPIEFDEAYDYDFSGTIEWGKPDDAVFFRFIHAKDEAELAERLKNPHAPKNQAYFLRADKLLFIPKTIFATLSAGETVLSIGIEQKLFKPKPDASSSSLRSPALAYKYNLNTKLNLK